MGLIDFIQRFQETRLSPGTDASSALGEQYVAMEIRRGATGKIEHRVCYYHPNLFKRYWVRLLLTFGIKKGEEYCGNCIDKRRQGNGHCAS